MTACIKPVDPSTNGEYSSENPLLEVLTEIPLKLLWKNAQPSNPPKYEADVEMPNPLTDSDVKFIELCFAPSYELPSIVIDVMRFDAVRWKQLRKIVQFSP